MAFKRFWAELKSSEFAALDPNSTLAILPVAATEQHGPHLPVMTDTAIAEGMISTVLAREIAELPADGFYISLKVALALYQRLLAVRNRHTAQLVLNRLVRFEHGVDALLGKQRLLVIEAHIDQLAPAIVHLEPLGEECDPTGVRRPPGLNDSIIGDRKIKHTPA